MIAKWVNWRTGLVIGAVVLGAISLFPSSGVREIHNAGSVSNFALVDPQPHVDDWPWWRGTDGRNVAASDRLPTQWSLSENEGWHIPIPGQGHATPILWGEQLFLLTSDPIAQRIVLRSHDRGTGRAIWQTDLHQSGLPKIHEKKTHASSTPACDGQFVFAVAAAHDALCVTSVDLMGRIVWQREVGSYQSKSGYSSSPVFYKSLVIVAADQEKDGCLTAFHRQTGAIVWRVKRPDGDSSGSPIVATIAGRSQLILGGMHGITSYDPVAGNELWTYRWSAERMASSVAFDGEHVFATNKQPDGEVVCIKANGSGDVTNSHLVWRRSRIASEIPSPIIHDGLLYILSDDGRLSCLQTATGKIEWRKQIEGTFSASPVIAGEYLICSSEAGNVTILQTGVSGNIVDENALSEGIIASPIVAGNSIFVRTLTSLRRIGSPESEPIVERPEPVRKRL